MKILKTKPSDNNNQIVRISKRSTLSNQEYEHWWYDSWFTDEFSKESSELSSETEESIEICNERKDIKVDQDIKFFYDCIIKIIFY